MSFGFDGVQGNRMLAGFRALVERLAENSENSPDFETHKDVRAIARLCLAGSQELSVPWEIQVEIQFLLGCLSLSQLPHYDRQFAAKRIVLLLDKAEKLMKDREKDELARIEL